MTMTGKQPHMRPVGVLTRDILDKSPAWAIVHKCQTFIVCPDDIRGDTIEIDGVGCDVVVVRCHDKEVSMLVSDCVCYPCESCPPFKPAPWPVLPGEEEIEKWRGRRNRKIEFIEDPHPALTYDVWAFQGAHPLPFIEARKGFHPAPRQGNRWVWEVDPT